ncbi:hypothetical protein VTN02DRAFT_397 [Thermoascus thermophilus]
MFALRLRASPSRTAARSPFQPIVPTAARSLSGPSARAPSTKGRTPAVRLARAGALRFPAGFLQRCYSTAAAQSQEPPKPRSRLRRVLGFAFVALVSFLGGTAYSSVKTAARVMAQPIPTNEETLDLFHPPDEFAREVDAFIQTHPLAAELRQNPAFTESRPHLKIPGDLRARNLTAGTLAGPDRIVVPPYVWSEEGGKSMVSIFYLGSDVCGHPGIVHGGMLATLLDEGLARCCFPALPNGVGVTANLNIDYRRPAPANSYMVLRAETVKVEGRKAWVEGRIETLPEEGKEPEVLVEAKALFIEPKYAKQMASLYKVT